MRPVAVTGMGVVSPIGSSLASYAGSLFAGRSGAGPVTVFDPADLPTQIAAEVKERFDGAGLADRKIAFALEASRQAFEAAGRPDGRGAGLALGVGLEVFRMDDMAAYRTSGGALPEELGARLGFLQTPSDVCVHLIARRFGLDRPPVTLISACAAGTDAIGVAARLVATGRRRWMLAGGTDSMVNPLGMGGFCKIGAMSTRNDEPGRASRPFDAARDGFVLGEGAAVLVLETLDDAAARGAHVHALVLGYGSSFDAHGIAEPHPEGRGAWQAMTRALADAGLSPGDVDAVNAHGTSTPKNDVVETLALKRLLGERAGCVPVVSTKSMIGHCISAAGALEAVAAIVCLEAQRLHPTINLDDPDPECDLDHVPAAARDHAHRVVLSNSFGFGGQNASIVLARPD